jgi:hypothetical protein
MHGKLDSGCDNKWISSEALARTGPEDQVERIENSAAYVAFGEQEFRSSEKIDITWFAAPAGVSGRTTFFVRNALSFDIVVGRISIADKAIFVFNKLALALKQGNYTKGNASSSGQEGLFIRRYRRASYR